MTVAATATWQSMLYDSMFEGHIPTATKVQRLATSALASGMEPFKKAVRGNVKRLRK